MFLFRTFDHDDTPLKDQNTFPSASKECTFNCVRIGEMNGSQTTSPVALIIKLADKPPAVSIHALSVLGNSIVKRFCGFESADSCPNHLVSAQEICCHHFNPAYNWSQHRNGSHDEPIKYSSLLTASRFGMWHVKHRLKLSSSSRSSMACITFTVAYAISRRPCLWLPLFPLKADSQEQSFSREHFHSVKLLSNKVLSL